MHALRPAILSIGALLVFGCTEDPDQDDGGAATETSVDSGSDGGETEGCVEGDVAFPARDILCSPKATDYVPGADDMWPTCVQDDGDYHLVDTSPSSIARVEAYETIMDLLAGDPRPDAFTEARSVYAMDEGLESRLVRREDLRYPPIPMSDWDPGVDADKQCTVPGNLEKYPDRCAGPAKIAPLVNEAFAAGQTGEGDPAIHRARLDASFLWFYAISVLKEANTCITAAAKDCDSSWAYYTGGENRAGGIGLSAQVKAVSPEAHEAIWNGFSAFRCLRERYPADDDPTLDDLPAEGQTMFEHANAQLRAALAFGVAQLVRDRLIAQATLCDGEAEANWAWLRIMGPVLEVDAVARDAATWATLDALWQSSAPATDELVAGVEALDALFPCPQDGG